MTQRNRARRFARHAIVTVALFVTACSRSGGDAVTVSGAVTYDGRPVTSGTVFFEPDATAGNTGPQGIAEFRDGRYQTNPAFGAKPGPNVVRIELTALPAGATAPTDPDAPLPAGTAVGVFEKKLVVPADGPAVIDFDIRPQDLRR